jgi:hypothetical protein
MKFALTVTAFLILMAQGNASAAQTPAFCPGFELGGSNRSDIDEFYVGRALQIIQFANQEDRVSLAKLVAPEAKFELWRGDYTSSARQLGADGAIEWTRDLKPQRFQTGSPVEGPFAYLATEDCVWSVSILFRGGDAQTNVETAFSFRDGWLIAVRGHEVRLIEGDVP